MQTRSLAAALAIFDPHGVRSPMPVAAQESEPRPPRTPWGAPDLQGVWDFRTITPMERPEEYGDREFLTAEESAESRAGRAGTQRPPRRTERDPDGAAAGGGERRRLQQLLDGPRHEGRRHAPHFADCRPARAGGSRP